jgi:hypothetical protein
MSADIRPGWAVFGVCWRRRSVAVVAVIVAVTFAVGASSALPAAEPLTRLGKGFVSAARNAIDAATMPQVVGSNLYLHLGIIAACGCQHLPDFDRTHITAVIFEHAFYRLGAIWDRCQIPLRRLPPCLGTRCNQPLNTAEYGHQFGSNCL